MPNESTGAKVTSHPVRIRARAVSMTAGCSTALTIRWAGSNRCRNPVRAMLSDSVPPLVKTISLSAAPRAPATWARARSTASRPSRPSAWISDGLPYRSTKYGIMRSKTRGSTAVVAAWSK